MNARGSTVWTLSTPTTWSFQTSGTEHIEVKRAWSTPRIQAKRGSSWTSRLVDGPAGRGGDAGDAPAQRQAGDADGLLVEAVRRRERHAAAVAIHEVERADVGARGGLGAVDDRAHQLVPRARRGREVRDLGRGT